MTFDGWNAQLCAVDLSYGQDSLMHFRTKGSKNGVRRYQETDGTWTPLGLKERRAREGWGERRAARKEARAERRAARAAERSANFERARQYKQQQAEIRRKRNPKNLTDAELKKGIERLKLEQEYRELNRSPLLQTGANLANKYIEYKARKEEAETRKIERQMQLEKMNTDRINAWANLNRAKADRARARADATEVVLGRKASANKAKLVEAKTKYREGTIWGGIGKFFNKQMSSIADSDDSMRKAQAQVDSILKSRTKIDLYNDVARRTGRQTMDYELTPDQKEQKKQEHLENLGRIKAEQERQKARQEKYKSRRP